MKNKKKIIYSSKGKEENKNDQKIEQIITEEH
jgi:hypothetical protein